MHRAVRGMRDCLVAELRFDTVLSYYPVRDLSATRDFYERDLGLRVARDVEGCLILAAGRALVGFCQSEEPEGARGQDVEGGGQLISFVLRDVDACYSRLRRLGIETEGPPRDDLGSRTRRFFTRDPDGYRIEVQRSDLIPT